MSAHDCSPTLRACENVLLMIFQHLDGQDLLHCEAVCRQWRQVMLAGKLWRRWLNQRTKWPELRPFWQKVELDESNPLPDYRAVCRVILRPLLRYQLDYWRHGKYEQSFLTLNVLDDVLTNGSYIYRSIAESKNRHVITLDRRGGKSEQPIALKSKGNYCNFTRYHDIISRLFHYIINMRSNHCM